MFPERKYDRVSSGSVSRSVVFGMGFRPIVRELAGDELEAVLSGQNSVDGNVLAENQHWLNLIWRITTCDSIETHEHNSRMRLDAD